MVGVIYIHSKIQSIWSTLPRRRRVYFPQKKALSPRLPLSGVYPIPIGDHIELLGVNISSNLNFDKCIESKAKVAAKKLGILNKVRRYFTPGQRLALYQAQVRTSMEYCSHLWGGSAKYQFEALDSVDRRARRIIGDNSLTQSKLHSLQHRERWHPYVVDIPSTRSSFFIHVSDTCR
ncbi:jg15509 [Pararge aegeria aegeria]|uniref:Jg15509 protein n=1 Tax=Pararge aegeria aegeria TaxID=348720 RepID=A0A8S4R7Y2_9NEOP|nr:jg15509 [Pararge aegeria aegeria]